MCEQCITCDVLVLGAGPAGIAAACVAAERGGRVVLLESTPWLGGAVWRETAGSVLPRNARSWLARLQRCGAQVVLEATAFGQEQITAAGTGPVRRVLAEQQGRLLEVQCQNLVIATGGAGTAAAVPRLDAAASDWIGRAAVAGQEWLAAAGQTRRRGWQRSAAVGRGRSTAQKGAHIVAVLEQAPWRQVARFAAQLPWLGPGKIWQAARLKAQLMGTAYRTGCWPVAAVGSQVLQSVRWTDGRREWERPCDYLACGFGLVPNLQWPHLLACAVRDGAAIVDVCQQTSQRGVYAIGETTGIGGDEPAVLEGQIAGHAASGGGATAAVRRWRASANRARRFAHALQTAFALRGELFRLADDDTIVCRCEDVTWGQVRPYRDAREAKLQSRCGMGACQGRVCHQTLRLLKGWSAPAVRPPVLPVSAGTWAAVAVKSPFAPRK